MTLPTKECVTPVYIGNDVAVDFDFDFKVFNATDLVWLQTDTEGNETTLVLNQDYSVTGLGENKGGYITLLKGALPKDYKLQGSRIVPDVQPTSLSDKYNAEVIEHEFDYLTMITQQLDQEIKDLGDASGAEKITVESDDNTVKQNCESEYDPDERSIKINLSAVVGVENIKVTSKDKSVVQNGKSKYDPKTKTITVDLSALPDAFIFQNK